jgi:hypothetical protein
VGGKGGANSPNTFIPKNNSFGFWAERGQINKIGMTVGESVRTGSKQSSPLSNLTPLYVKAPNTRGRFCLPSVFIQIATMHWVTLNLTKVTGLFKIQQEVISFIHLPSTTFVFIIYPLCMLAFSPPSSIKIMYYFTFVLLRMAHSL